MFFSKLRSYSSLFRHNTLIIFSDVFLNYMCKSSIDLNLSDLSLHANMN